MLSFHVIMSTAPPGSAVLAALLDDGTLGQKHDLRLFRNSSQAMGAATEENPHEVDMSKKWVKDGEGFG